MKWRASDERVTRICNCVNPRESLCRNHDLVLLKNSEPSSSMGTTVLQ